jgi:excisionase family DNA binding protein
MIEMKTNRESSETSFLSLSQVGKQIGRSEKTVRRMVDAGEILARRFRGHWIVTTEDLMNWVSSLPTNKGAAK